MAQEAPMLLAGANEMKPTIIKMVKRVDTPVKYIVRRPTRAMRNHDRMVPITPNAYLMGFVRPLNMTGSHS